MRQCVYDVEVYGPTGTRSVRVEADRVAHVRYQWDARAPWRGLSPLDGAATTSRLLGGIEAQFSAEAASPSGYAWPMPDTGDRGRGDGDDDDDTDPLNDLKKSLQDANGRTLLLPTTAAGWGVGAGAAPPRDFTSPARFGFNPPDGTRQVRQDAERCIAFCYGLPSTFNNANTSQIRDTWRVLVNLTLPGLAATIAAQLGPAIGVPDLAFDFEAARQSDVVSLARAYRSLRDAGMDDAAARDAVGLLT